MDIVYFANHDVGCACLERLIKHNFAPRLVIVQQTDKEECLTYQSVEKLAQCNGIETFLYKPAWHNSLILKLKDISPDLLISVAWRYIFKKDILKLPRLAAINFHGSLLPKCRGANPTNWAIISGEKETGVTAHFIDEGIDTGDVIIQKKIKIGNDDTAYSLRIKQDKVSISIMDELISYFPSGKFPRKQQNDTEATFFKQRKPEDGLVHWDSMTSQQVYDFVRALTKPYPGAFFQIGDEKITLWKVRSFWKEQTRAPGIFEIPLNGDPFISTIDGYIALIEFECLEKHFFLEKGKSYDLCSLN